MANKHDDSGSGGKRLRAAVDVGGTFTDLVLIEDESVVRTVKVLTTPDDPSRAVLEGLAELLDSRDLDFLAEIIHGTTLVANALIERKGAVTALITTDGFRDVLASGREQRYDLYDLYLEVPAPLVPRRRRLGVKERILADGTVDTELDESDVAAAAKELGEEVETVAVCLLHAYRNPVHEEMVRRGVKAALPGVSVSLSSEVSPEIGEYERVSTTVANAYVRPVVDEYLDLLQKRLSERGISAPLRIMLSTGGLASTDAARQFPVRLLESGPAAGVLAAGYLAGGGATKRVLAFDMGGTTAKAALLEGGEPILSRKMEAARVYRFKRGSGLPIRIPVIDMIEIGAGGGSLARVGDFGLPKVGPESASSVPGPVSYGKGGHNPTVTDADLVLGLLNPDFFLGGTMELDVQGAISSLGDLGDEMGFSSHDAAAAVHRVVNENMASAARMHAIELGRDIRDYTLVATGGAGPVHAWGIARILRITNLVFPPRAGVASAFGMLTAPTSYEFARSMPSTLADTDWQRVEELLKQMGDEGRFQLDRSGVVHQELRISADVRYEGQGDSLTVDLGDALESDQAAHVDRNFEEQYLALYGSKPSNVEAEVLTWRVRVSGPRPAPMVNAVWPTLSRQPTKGSRQAWFPEVDGFVETAVYDRYALTPGYEFEGPALIEEMESTIAIGPGARALVAGNGNVEVTVQ